MIFASPALLAAPVFSAFADGREKWTLDHDAHSLVFKGEKQGDGDVALLLDPEGLGTTIYRIVFSSDGKVRSDIAREASPCPAAEFCREATSHGVQPLVRQRDSVAKRHCAGCKPLSGNGIPSGSDIARSAR